MINATKLIAASQAKSAQAPPKVIVRAPPKQGEVVAGVDEPDASAPRATKPVVKVQYNMAVKKFDGNTSAALKAAFARGLGGGVAAADIKITSATFEVKSKVSFSNVATVAEFTSSKEAGFKSGLATDLMVNVSQIAVTVTAKARRHLLAGVTVDYTVSGIETFETAASMSTVAKSASALPSVIAAVGVPAVESAGVEAKLEFEIETEDATAVAAKLQDSATLATIAADVPDVSAAPTVVGTVSTVNPSPPPPSPPPPSPPPAPPPSPPPGVAAAASGAPGVASAAAALACVLLAVLVV